MTKQHQSQPLPGHLNFLYKHYERSTRSLAASVDSSSTKPPESVANCGKRMHSGEPLKAPWSVRSRGHIDQLQLSGLHLGGVPCCSSRRPPRQGSKVGLKRPYLDDAREENLLKRNDRTQSERSGTAARRDHVVVDGLVFRQGGDGNSLQLKSKSKRVVVRPKSSRARGHVSVVDVKVSSASDGKQVTKCLLRSEKLPGSTIVLRARDPVVEALPESPPNRRHLARSTREGSEIRRWDKMEKIRTESVSVGRSRRDLPSLCDSGDRCDLCNMGPSVSLGEWIAWCCGFPASRCSCTNQKRVKMQKMLGPRKTQTMGKKIRQLEWTGNVHKMCALWSSEVYETDSTKKGYQLRLVDAAVKRGNGIVCKDPECRNLGATLGCRVKVCRRSYHYPCAERLASKCLVRMWDCPTIPIACLKHRAVEVEVDRAKEVTLPGSVQEFDQVWRNPVQSHLGKNLLSSDIARGQEAVQIPCTNDVDDEPLPEIKYITKCWRNGSILGNLHPEGTRLAKGCEGCSGPRFDSFAAPMSVHVRGTGVRSRESDKRLDWQSESMHGRLPYDVYGLLLLGPETKDIVECNSRCKCGPGCRNRELQNGLQVPLELYRTEDRGWGVRSLQQIPRGRFVVEYVGEVLTQAEADKRAEKYDENQMSYLFNLDHPDLNHEDLLVLDGIYQSNVARFINHSCEGNLMIYRVYTETTVAKYCRIGMYAIQDIEVGEELTYDYNYDVSEEWTGLPSSIDDPTAIRCCCGAQSCRKWLWLAGNPTESKH